MDEIPTSQLPNTTLKTLLREIPELKYRFFDTPGIPNEVTLGREMSGLLQKNRNLVIAKRIKPERVDLSNGDTLYIGALARIDYNYLEKTEETTRILAHIYCAYDVSLHRTAVEKANEVYLKHYGGLLSPVYDEDVRKVQFKAHEIELEFAKNGECLQIMEIFGLGWVRFSKISRNNAERVKILLFLPESVRFGFRDSVMQLQDSKNPETKVWEIKRKKREKGQKV